MFQQILSLPSTGDSVQVMPGWMVSAEGRVICEGVQPTFTSQLAAVFATFYIFNLQYQDEGVKTLDFIQRYNNFYDVIANFNLNKIQK